MWKIGNFLQLAYNQVNTPEIQNVLKALANSSMDSQQEKISQFYILIFGENITFENFEAFEYLG